MTAVMTVAEVEHASRSFAGVRAVSDLSLSIHGAEIYGLVGPDGAGKTTTLRMLAGALDPDEGRIQVMGIDVGSDPDRARERIGYMPQLYGLYTDLSVRENLWFFGRLFGVPSTKLARRIGDLLEFVRLAEFPHRRAGDLSGGMYKKLAIACSILHEPRLLILDEPTNGVDPVSRRDLWSLLFSLADEGVSIIVSTPYMDEAERCHRIGLLFNGVLAAEGPPAVLLRDLEGRVFLLRSSNPSAMLRSVREALPAGASASSSPDGIRVQIREKEDRSELVVLARKHVLSAPEPVRAGIEDLLIEIQDRREERT